MTKARDSRPLGEGTGNYHLVATRNGCEFLLFSFQTEEEARTMLGTLRRGGLECGSLRVLFRRDGRRKDTRSWKERKARCKSSYPTTPSNATATG